MTNMMSNCFVRPAEGQSGALTLKWPRERDREQRPIEEGSALECFVSASGPNGSSGSRGALKADYVLLFPDSLSFGPQTAQ